MPGLPGEAAAVEVVILDGDPLEYFRVIGSRAINDCGLRVETARKGGAR